MKAFSLFVSITLFLLAFSGCDSGGVYVSNSPEAMYQVRIERYVAGGENPVVCFLAGGVERKTDGVDYLILRAPIYTASEISWYSSSSEMHTMQALGLIIGLDSMIIELLPQASYQVEIVTRDQGDR